MRRFHTDEQLIIDYLLGSLSESETERLDEMCITDEKFAGQVDAVENDLVDSFVRSELSEEMLAKFQFHYLASPRRRENVAYAKAFINAVDNSSMVRAARMSARKSGFFASLLIPQWGLAAAGLLLVIAACYFWFENNRLQNQIAQMKLQEQDLHRRQQPRDVVLLAFNLSPQNRGISKLPLLFIPAGTDSIAFNLELEVNDFPAYQAALIDPAMNQELWNSGKIKAANNSNWVHLKVLSSLLKNQNYVLELYGIPQGNQAEYVGGYSFTAKVQ